MNFLPEFFIFCQIVLIDVTLAGDNAMAIGMAAAGLPKEQRHRAIVRGIIIAAILRIVFATCAVQLLHVVGLLAVGGLLLLWVSWKMYEELRHFHQLHKKKTEHAVTPANDSPAPQKTEILPLVPHKSLSLAVLQIAVADVSMSLDNVLAVAGVARNHLFALIFGLSLSVFLMGVAAAVLARVISHHRWIAWLGLALVLYTAMRMIWEGGQDILRATG